MKGFRTGTRVSAVASFLLVGACMAGENTASKAEVGINPADGSSAGGGSDSGNINNHFQVTPLTADQPGVAPNTDRELKDVWGVTSLEEQFWAVAQQTGQVIGLSPEGVPTMHIPLVEEGQKATKADRTATGVALNDSADLLMDIGGDCRAAAMLVAAQSGKIWAVNPDISETSAFVLVDRSEDGAQYTGVAIIHPTAATPFDGSGGGGTPPPAPVLTRVLAVDFHNGRVDQFDVVGGALHRVASAASQFAIPNLKANFSPFGIFATGDRVILTAAKRRGAEDGDPQIDQQVPGDGLGIVAAFDLTGKLLWRTESPMFNIPWGMAMGDLRLCATSALLVGQHGDPTRFDGPNNQFGGATIAMDIRTGKIVTPLLDGDTHPVRVRGLWGLTFATGITTIDEQRLHMGAGPVMPGNGGLDETEHGLFVRLDMRTP
jgi:uncharacterized protein (TIGR03118 family)